MGDRRSPQKPSGSQVKTNIRPGYRISLSGNYRFKDVRNTSVAQPRVMPNTSQPWKCRYCDRHFVFHTTLLLHEKRHIEHRANGGPLNTSAKTAINDAVKKSIAVNLQNERKDTDASHGTGTKKDGSHETIAEKDGSQRPDAKAATTDAVNKFKCDYCQQQFDNVSNLREHEESHNLKAFKASVAQSTGKDFPENAIEFMCLECNAVFGTEEEFEKHSTTHEAALKYKCLYCEEGFTSHIDTHLHESKHTGGIKHLCIFCDKQLKSRAYLKHHISLHFVPGSKTCTICEKSFVNAITMQCHVNIIHKDTPEKVEVSSKVVQRGRPPLLRTPATKVIRKVVHDRRQSNWSYPQGWSVPDAARSPSDRPSIVLNGPRYVVKRAQNTTMREHTVTLSALSRRRAQGPGNNGDSDITDMPLNLGACIPLRGRPGRFVQLSPSSTSHNDVVSRKDTSQPTTSSATFFETESPQNESAAAFEATSANSRTVPVRAEANLDEHPPFLQPTAEMAKSNPRKRRPPNAECELKSICLILREYGLSQPDYLPVIWSKSFDLELATDVAFEASDCIVCVNNFLPPSLMEILGENCEQVPLAVEMGSEVRTQTPLHCFVYGKVTLSDIIAKDSFDSYKSLEENMVKYAATNGRIIVHLFRYPEYEDWCDLFGDQLKERTVIARRFW